MTIPAVPAQLDPVRAEFQEAVADLRMQVDRHTVLQARGALLAEALRLRMALHAATPNAHVGLCGGDPVSPFAAQAFNERIDALLDWCRQYVEDLEAAGHGLGDMARSYGYTEDEIATSFNAATVVPR